MNREDVIRMALEAGAAEFYPSAQSVKEQNYIVSAGFLERFAALVAAAERNECAKVCSDRAMRCELDAIQAIENGECDEASAIRSTAWQISVCADAISKRSKTQSMP